MAKETLMNADNKEPNLSSKPPEMERFLTGSIKALDRVCVGLPFKRPLSCSRRTFCSRLRPFGALSHGNSELCDTETVILAGDVQGRETCVTDSHKLLYIIFT